MALFFNFAEVYFVVCALEFFTVNNLCTLKRIYCGKREIIGVGKFRILEGARFRILGAKGGANS